MGEKDVPTYEHLKATCDELQRQITLSLAVKQDLIEARTDLDRDLARFKAIESFSRVALHAKSVRDFMRIIVEAVVESFEVECSALFMYDEASKALHLVESFGFEAPVDGWRLETGWIQEKGLRTPRNAFVGDSAPPLGGQATGLSQTIVCPFHDAEGDLEGLVLGGISAAKRTFYEAMDEKLVPSFTVFTRQVASLYHNLESQQLIRKTVKELSTLYTIGTAIVSILDMDQLVDTVLRTIVRDLMYDRAMILMVDEEKRVLSKGQIRGGTAGMEAYVQRLELPISEDNGVLSRVAFCGNPILVRDARNGSDTVAMDIVTALETPSFLAVPLKSKGRTIGVMAVDNYRTGAELGDDDLRLISTLAGQVAISIENARLYDSMKTLNSDLEEEIAEHEKAEVALRRAHDELELRVKERTAELSMANDLLQQEVVERRRMERELQEAKRVAEEANRAKSDFLANMSHELRTPMNAVLGFSEMILDGVYGDPLPEIREVVGEIQKSGEHLLGLINDVLDISKIEAGRMELRLSEHAVEECVGAVTGRLEPLAKEKGLELITEIQEGLPVCTFDQKRITQVLLNLVGNAIKFTRTGRVKVGARVEEGHLLLTVADTGIGIPERELDRIFTEFHQADSSVSREAQGSGLGLAIAKSFVEMHGGRIGVESKVGTGSTFWLTLPLRRT